MGGQQIDPGVLTQWETVSDASDWASWQHTKKKELTNTVSLYVTYVTCPAWLCRQAVKIIHTAKLATLSRETACLSWSVMTYHRQAKPFTALKWQTNQAQELFPSPLEGSLLWSKMLRRFYSKNLTLQLQLVQRKLQKNRWTWGNSL